MKPIFELEVYRPGTYTSGDVSLPATPHQLRDAFDRARVFDDRDIYQVDVSYSHLECLEGRVPENTNPFWLNELATQLATLDDDELDIFAALVEMEQKKSPDKPISIQQLYNLSHSTDGFHFMRGIRRDVSLGRFLYENDLLGKEETEQAMMKEAFSDYAEEYYQMLGARYRSEGGGYFTKHGFIANIGEIEQKQFPEPHSTSYRPKTLLTLNVSKGFFDDPDYDNNSSLELPAPFDESTEEDLLNKLGVASFEECGYHVLDCAVPGAMDLLDEAQDFSQVFEFGKELEKAHAGGALLKYKALFTAVDPKALDDATGLFQNIDLYHLDEKCPDAAVYTQARLEETIGPEAAQLFAKFTNLLSVGPQLMKLENVVLTDYGTIQRTDGKPIQELQQDDAPAGPVMEM